MEHERGKQKSQDGGCTAAQQRTILSYQSQRKNNSKKDVLKRTKMNATQFEKMNLMGVFDGLPEDDSFSH